MAAQQNFRTAFNGFNREDVVQYIEYLNSKHIAELNQLKAELEYLHNKPAAEPVVEYAVKDDAVNSIVEEQAARIRELFDENKELKARLDAALSQKEPAQTYSMEAELEVYRRAERVERMAKQRAEQMYRQANGVIADATLKVEEAAAQIGSVSESVVAHLAQLQQAVSGSNAALKDAASCMLAIRPETEE